MSYFNRSRVQIVVFLLMVLALPASARAQSASLTGHVVDAATGDPVVGANAVLQDLGRGAATALDGTFRLVDVAPGRYTLVVTAIGYAPAEAAVVLTSGEAAAVRIVLEASAYALRDVMVTATRSRSVATALPMKVLTVEAREVARQRSLVSSPAELLANVIPSFSPPRQKLSGAGESFRGRRPLYLIDGVPQSNPLRDGRRDGFTIDPEVIERVEVVFGANAVQGLGATGGIVNYVTVSPPVGGALAQRLSLSTTANDGFARDGLGWRGHYLAAKRIGRVEVLGAVSYEQRGLQYDGSGRRIALDNVQGDIADSHSRNLFAKVGWTPAAAQRLQLMVNDFRLAQEGEFDTEAGDRAQGLPAVSIPGAPEGTQPFNDVTTVALDYEHAALWNGTFSAKAYYQDFAALYGGGRFGTFQDPSLAPEGELFDQSENNSEKLGTRLTYARGGVGRLPLGVVGGVDLLRDKTYQRLVVTNRNWVPVTVFYNAAPFVQLDAAPVEALTFSAGLRWEFATLDVPDFTTLAGNRTDRQRVRVAGGSPRFDAPLLNVGAVVRPLRALRLYGSFAQAFTMPDVGRVLRGISQENTAVEDFLALDPIKTDNVEVGGTLAAAWGMLGVTYFTSSAAFGSRLVPNEDGIFQVQRDPTETSGWEVNGRLEPLRAWALSAGYSWLKGRYDSDGDGTLDADLGAGDIGPNRLSVAADLNRTGWLSGRVQAFTFFDRTFRDGAGAQTAQFEGYTTVDASATAALGRAAVTLAVSNLLDRQYVTYFSQAATTRADQYFAGRGRTLTVRVDVRL